MPIEAFQRLPEVKRQAMLAAGINEFSTRSYSEAGTDAITSACGISKGLLFHYFGSKLAFYLFCLDTALSRLTARTPEPCAGGFYDMLFAALDDKLRLCRELPSETRFVNLAARDMSREGAGERSALLASYTVMARKGSDAIMERAASALTLKSPDDAAVKAALRLYTGALINRYLLMYRETPLEFFSSADTIKAELKRDIDMLLYGICKERAK